jgi:predicted PurR-regulated permease PerM
MVHGGPADGHKSGRHRLHPLAVILSLAVGGVPAGIVGAVVAVPIVAVITRALPELRRTEPEDLGPDDP